MQRQRNQTKVKRPAMDRMTRLKNWIDAFNGRFDANGLNMKSQKRAEVMMGMYEVISVTRSEIVLKVFENRLRIGPVIPPQGLAQLLEPGDLFLWTLVKTKAGWEPSFISHPYEVEEWREEDDEEEESENDSPLARYLSH